MTDNEIIKALECCTGRAGENACVVCPFIHTDNCMKQEEFALDLLNRQKAEIERLQKGTAELADESDARDIDEYNMICRVRAEAIKEFVERLQCLILPQLGISTLEKKEAYYFCLDEINTLVKQMVGDNNG